ncbi:MAG: HAD family hydrolase [Clostridia bacterium]|nr:HAD family hydrolase [Clostridia bacterium]
MIDHIIWDWNGTLLNDVQYGITLINRLLREYHKPELESIQAYHRVFTFPVKNYYAAIGFGDDIFDEVAVKWMDAYMKDEACCPLRTGAVEIANLFHSKNIRQVVISASKLSNLHIQMASRPYFSFFDAPRGLGDIYAGSKIDISLDWMKTSGAKPENTLLIGDTLHDKAVADALSCRCILVENGHQSREALLQSGAAVARDLFEAADMVLKGQGIAYG